MTATHLQPVDLPNAVREVAALARALVGKDAGDDLEAALARAERREVDVVVLGQFKRGKTTLINALIGRDLLPRAAVPLTSVITVVRQGPRPRIEVMFEGGGRREIPFAELEEYVTERGNPQNARAVHLVEIEVDGPVLAGGLVLIDTPGTGSIYRHNTDVARGFLPHADAALFVLSADPPISDEEREDLAAVRAAVPYVICVLNKIDQVDPAERQTVLDFTREHLRAAAGGELPLVVVSARGGLQGRLDGDPAALEESGVPELERIVDERIGRRRRLIGEEGVRRRAVRILDSVDAAVGLQRRAAELGERESRARLDRFRDMARQIQLSLDEDMLTTVMRAHRLLREWLDPWLRERVTAGVEELERELQARERTGAVGRPDDLHGWLADELERIIGHWLLDANRQLAEVVDPVLRESAERANEIRQRALTEAVALFDLAPPPPRAAADPVVADTTGLLRLDDQATGGLELAATAVRRSLPGALGRRAAVRATRRQAHDLLDRHAGRLRFACASALDRACRTLSQRRAAALEESLRLVEGAVDAAAEASRRSASQRRDDAARTDALLGRTAVLRAALERG